MTLPPGHRTRLQDLRECADGDIDLARAALDLAALRRPGTALGPYHRHLEALAREVGQYAGADPDAGRAHEALVQVIAKRYGYAGDDDVFDEVEAADLAHVIDDRRGLPVALGIIYIQTARAQGWTADGIDFPGRFLARLEVGGRRVIVDAHEGGRSLAPKDLRAILKSGAGLDAELEPDHYQTLDNRGILLRLQNNLKVRLLRAERFEDALAVIDSMILFSPETSALWREAGMIHARLDNVRQAVWALEEFLRLDTRDANRYSTTVLLQELRARLT